MLTFPTTELMDEQKCYGWLVDTLHPGGLCCDRCGMLAMDADVHRRDRAPVLYYRCDCGRIYNAFAGTLWQGTQRSCSQIVAILQGFAQGKSTAHLARELDTDRGWLLELRHQIQANALEGCPPESLPDAVAECDEMYQNAGEKKSAPSRSNRSAKKARQ